MFRRAISCLRHDARRLLFEPRAWTVVILTFLYIENQFAPIRQMLVAENLTLNLFGMASFFLNDAQVTMLLGLGLLMLLYDAPFLDETQRYIIVRSGRGAWGFGQVGYVVTATLAYLLLCVLALFICQAPFTDWSGGWSNGLDVLINEGAYEYYNTMLEYDPWIMQCFSPMASFLSQMGLHMLAFTTLALLQYAVNCLGRSRLGFLPSAALLLFDGVIEEYFFENVYYFSPVTLSRLSALDYGDDMGRPPIWYAVLVLFVLTAALGALCVHLSRRRELSL